MRLLRIATLVPLLLLAPAPNDTSARVPSPEELARAANAFLASLAAVLGDVFLHRRFGDAYSRACSTPEVVLGTKPTEVMRLKGTLEQAKAAQRKN